MNKSTIVTQHAYPLCTHVSHVYTDAKAQACNFIETVWRDIIATKSTIILLN